MIWYTESCRIACLNRSAGWRSRDRHDRQAPRSDPLALRDRKGKGMTTKPHPTKATEGIGNVFEDLGLSDLVEFLAKARLVSVTSDIISGRNRTQAEAAHLLGRSQPTASNLMNGRLDGFSLATSGRLRRPATMTGLLVLLGAGPGPLSGGRPVSPLGPGGLAPPSGGPRAGPGQWVDGPGLGTAQRRPDRSPGLLPGRHRRGATLRRGGGPLHEPPPGFPPGRAG